LSLSPSLCLCIAAVLILRYRAGRWFTVPKTQRPWRVREQRIIAPKCLIGWPLLSSYSRAAYELVSQRPFEASVSVIRRLLEACSVGCCPTLPRKDRPHKSETHPSTDVNNSAKPNNTISCEGNGGCASNLSQSGPPLLEWPHTAIHPMPPRNRKAPSKPIQIGHFGTACSLSGIGMNH
jgi:hypothetical protein